MRYCRLPANMLRSRFGFEFLPDFDKRIWTAVKSEAEKCIRNLPEGLISAGDILSLAVKSTRINLSHLPYGKQIQCRKMDFHDISPVEPSVIVCNPPYGIRKGDQSGLDVLYSSLGDWLKQKCQGSDAYIYVGDRELIRHFGLKPSLKIPLKNGGLDGRLVKYQMY